MSSDEYYLFKGLLVFGSIFAFLGWQWWDVERDIKRAKAKKELESAGHSEGE